jgi:hypothetical protein
VEEGPDFLDFRDQQRYHLCMGGNAGTGLWGHCQTVRHCMLHEETFLHQSYGTVNGQFGWSFVILSVLCLATNGIAVKYGKRAVFLAGNIIILCASIGAIFCNTWHGLLATQLIGSIGRAPYETLVAATVTDL